MSWFRKVFSSSQTEASPKLSLSWLNADMHSHFIPGIDDGSQSMDETLALVLKMKELGYQKCITTPHIKMDMFPNTEDLILRGGEEVNSVLAKRNIDFPLEVAAEYFLDDSVVPKIQNKSLLTFGKQNHVLVEFSFNHPPVYEKDIFKRMLDSGYSPILAHFERYLYFLGSVDAAASYREMGVDIQMNLNSLTGYYGPGIRKQAELMLDDNLVDFIGTDAHRMEHLMMIEEHLSLPYFHSLGNRLFKNISL
jgi:tyrosine-protein phosphatase YwqE